MSEFKADAVKLVNSSSRPVTQIARELGVSESALRAWIKRVGNENDGVKPLSMEEQLKLGKKENEELRMEREILKRFAAFWVKETNGR
ncbi:MAG: transposase [Actinobacteria bacterium]|nr:transposase [Actinomycetota bacterium]MCL6104944.1 transposase [Actinomycetota bacterium]